MTTEIRSLRRSIGRGTAVRTTALVTLFSCASTAAMADPGVVRPDDTRTAKVSLAGLDLSTPEGARAAHDRLRLAAERLCVQLADTRKIEYRDVYFDCVRNAVNAAVRRINAPALMAVETSQSQR